MNTTAYHPQTDGLVEQFNRTLFDMLSKTAKQNGKDWDNCLPFILFAYWSSSQTSTGESPFYLLYGRDPKLPTEAVLCPPPSSALQVAADNYVTEITKRMSQAWSVVGDAIKKAQVQQKQHHDARARSATFVCLNACSQVRYDLQAGKAIPWALPCGSCGRQWSRSETCGSASRNLDSCGPELCP